MLDFRLKRRDQFLMCGRMKTAGGSAARVGVAAGALNGPIHSAVAEGAGVHIRGVLVIHRTIGQGAFHCRNCGGDRQYRLRSGRRFATVLFTPVIPLNKTDDHVQCLTCETKYHTNALATPTAEQMQAALPAGMRAAALAVLRSDDPGDPDARRRAIEAVIGAGAQDYDEAGLDQDLAEPAGDDDPALSQLDQQLAPQAKEWFLAEVVRIGMSDGPLGDPVRQAVQSVAADLGMTQAQAYGVISMTERAAASD